MNLAYYFTPALRVENLTLSPLSRSYSLRAHPDGILAWLIKIVGLGSTSRLSVDVNGFRRERSGFIGEECTYCPLPNVAATIYVMSKPFPMLILGGFFALNALFALMGGVVGDVGPVGFLSAFGLGVVAAVLIYLFLTRRYVVLGVRTNGGTEEWLRLKATLHQMAQLQQADKLTRQLVHASHGGAGTAPSAPTQHADFAASSPTSASADPFSIDGFDTGQSAAGPPPRHRAGSPAPFTISCPHCNSPLRVTPAHRGKQARCPSCRQTISVPESV